MVEERRKKRRMLRGESNPLDTSVRAVYLGLVLGIGARRDPSYVRTPPLPALQSELGDGSGGVSESGSGNEYFGWKANGQVNQVILAPAC